MTRDSLLAELRDLYSRRDSLSAAEGEVWVECVSEILHRVAPERGREFDEQTPFLFSGLSHLTMAPIWARTKGILRRAIAEGEADLTRPEPTLPDIRVSAPAYASGPDSAVVFVVHGRNDLLRSSLFAFLRALHLEPLEWSDALRATGKAAPYIGEILDSAFARAQAVVVLLSPDDEVRLTEALRTDDDDPAESQTLLQARPNVLFEAGLAFGSHPTRTVLVQVGQVKPFSDIAGRHVIRLDNTPERRSDLGDRLETTGCNVVRSGRDWLTVGDFRVSIGPQAEQVTPDTGSSPHGDLSIAVTAARVRGSRQIVVSNDGNATASSIRLLVDGAPISEHEVWVSNQDWPTSLRPGEQFHVLVAPTMGSPVRGDVRVEWSDPDGTEHYVDKMLQFV